MINFKKWHLGLIHIAFIIIFIALYKYNVININEFFQHSDSKSIHFNILTVNSIIAGFLFTGLSIILGLLDSEIVVKLERSSYMDRIYATIIYGIISSIISIVTSLIMIIELRMPIKIIKLVVLLELSSLIVSFIFFICSIINIYIIIKAIRNAIPRTSQSELDEFK